MVKSILSSGSVSGITTTANTTQYIPIIGNCDVGTNETSARKRVFEAGVVSRFHFSLYANSINNTLVVTLRKNGVDTSMTMSIATTQTGSFEDATHTETVASGDFLVAKTAPAAGSTGIATITYIYCLFTPTDTNQCVSTLCISNPTGLAGHTGASTRYYQPTNGWWETTLTTEATAQLKMQYSGTLKNMTTYLFSNSRTTTTTAEIRKGGVSQSLKTTYTSTVAGDQADTTNSVSVVDNDLINFSILNGTGTQATSWGHMSVELRTTGSPALSMYEGWYQNMPTQARNVSKYYSFTGYFDSIAAANEARCNFNIPDAGFTAKNLGVNVTQNSITPNASTFTLRKNATNTALSVSITASGTGWFEDTTNSASLADGDNVCLGLATGVGSGTQTVTIKHYFVSLEATSGAPAPVDCTVTGKAIATKQIVHG
jgi:hypothetical protein